MGSNNTRPKLTQVVPSHSSLERQSSQGEHRISGPISNWTTESLQSPSEEQQGSLGRRRNNQLPPLRQEVSLTFSPLTAGYMSHSHSSNVGHSIIQSHPPRRPQALQPLAPPTILLDGASKVLGTGQKSGAALHSFTHSQGGRCGTSSLLQAQGRVLEAQAVLGRQAHSQRRSHRRRAREMQEQRERRRQGRTIFTGNADGGDYGNEAQRVHLVKRPTERDIFWDMSSEEGLDLDDLSHRSPGPLERDRWRTPLSESHSSLGKEEPFWGELRQGDSRLSHQARARTTKNGRTGEADGHSKPSVQAAEKRLPWMLGWEGLEHRGRSPSAVSGNGEETLGWDTRSGWASSIRQEERIDPGKNGSPKSEEGWEFDPQVGHGRRHRGRLTRTKLELIPSFQNQLDQDSEM
ncbi:uncharacterized protein LOC118221820 isoform X1 [Anguilla anguilla]|uniref:uncharacterized protein LOC118221820 isoform X1 n=1 Tax=Anguilla anguilla TaxID=7936 RepID=UPI0015B13259|nr:uncharacterized protein LOC118221820 isoform X1 [Anguilla anguilla]